MNTSWLRYLLLRTLHPKAFADGAPEGLCLAFNAPARCRAALGVVEQHPQWLWVRGWDGKAVCERPVYLDAGLKKQIEGYFALTRLRPEMFSNSPSIPLNLNRLDMLHFHENTGKPIGLVFDNGTFYQTVCDLIDTPKPFGYARILYPHRRGNGTVILPLYQPEGQQPEVGILHVYRHALRQMSGGELPRGFQEAGLSCSANARKELQEEFGIAPEDTDEPILLGQTRPDTGICAGQVQIYLVRVHRKPPCPNVGSEGIEGAEWLPVSQLLDRIQRGELLDGMTQTAMLLLQLYLERT